MQNQFRNFVRARFCNLTSILLKMCSKWSHILKFSLATRGSPENFVNFSSTVGHAAEAGATGLGAAVEETGVEVTY